MEYQQKWTRLRQMLRAQELDGVLLTQQKNFSWLTSGRGFVNIASEKSVASLLVTQGSVTLIASNIEAERLMEEEIIGEMDAIQVFPWYEPSRMGEIVEELSKGKRVKDDLQLEADLFELRTKLTDGETIRIRELALETAQAAEETAFSIVKGETEYQIAARLSRNCLEREIEPIVNLAAVDDRVFTRRHPLPTGKSLEKYAMIVVCGRRRGQIVSATRLVHFGQPTEELRQRHIAAATVDSHLIYHTRPGVLFVDLFEKMKQAYESVGFGDEWKNHHQGGVSGYNSREQLLLPSSKQQVQEGQVFAWNPSIAGVKSEDTVLITEQGNEILSHTGQYPMLEIRVENVMFKRPDILIR